MCLTRTRAPICTMFLVYAQNNRNKWVKFLTSFELLFSATNSKKKKVRLHIHIAICMQIVKTKYVISIYSKTLKQIQKTLPLPTSGFLVYIHCSGPSVFQASQLGRNFCKKHKNCCNLLHLSRGKTNKQEKTTFDVDWKSAANLHESFLFYSISDKIILISEASFAIIFSCLI